MMSQEMFADTNSRKSVDNLNIIKMMLCGVLMIPKSKSFCR